MQCTSKLRSRDCSRRTNETSPSKTISASSRRRCRAVGRRASGAGAGLSDAAHHLGGSICRGRLLRRDRAGHHAAVERNPGPAGDRGKRRRRRVWRGETLGPPAGLVGVPRGAHAVPDGFWVLLGTVGPPAYTPALYKKLPYTPAAAFAPVGLAPKQPLVLFARKVFPANTL